jgi:hypothetical protein
MGKDLNISVLVAARDEYIEQLKCILSPLIMQGITSIYQDAYKITNGNKTIYKFQELLKQVPKWNQTILQEESKRIRKKYTYLMDIVTAIFVSNVKILASIRLSDDSENIRIKIPTCDLFLHSIYIETANSIFYDPFLFYHRTNDFSKIQKNKEIIHLKIRNAVDESIRRFIPYDYILEQYLQNALNDNKDSESGGSESSSEDGEGSLEGSILEEDFDDDDDEPLTKNIFSNELKEPGDSNINVSKKDPDTDDDDDDDDDDELPQPQIQPVPQPQQPHFFQPQPQQPTFQQPAPQPVPQTFQQPVPQTFQQPVPQTFQQPVPQTFQPPVPQENKYSFF